MLARSLVARSLLCALLGSAAVSAQDELSAVPVELNVPGPHRSMMPVQVVLPIDAVPASLRERLVLARLELEEGPPIPMAGRIEDDGVHFEFVLPKGTPAGEQVGMVSLAPEAHEFTGVFLDRGENREVFFRDGKKTKPVLRHFVPDYDTESHETEFKHFQHLYVPGTDTLLTKGPGGKFSHHRGLFIGWNKTRRGDGRWDFWHGRDGAHLRHREFVPTQSRGQVAHVSSTSIADWTGKDGDVVVTETRRIVAWQQPGHRSLLDIEITLEAQGDAGQVVELRGDPQHAGFQFRAAQEVAERAKETKYIRPSTAVGKKNDVWESIDWCAIDLPRTIGDGEDAKTHRILVQHIDHPANPRPIVYSTRDYGRFGSFFETDLKVGEPLTLRYRVFVSDLEHHPEDAEVERLQARADDLSKPVAFTINR